MMFRVGQKICCVDDSPTTESGRRELTKGAIYTVRWLGDCIDDCGSYFGVRIEEIQRSLHRFRSMMPDQPFDSNRFRPLIERKTSIEIFHSILRSASHKELT